MKCTFISRASRLLTNPVSIILGIAVGIVIGICFKGLVRYIKPVGDIYVRLLEMCVIPVMISAVIMSIGKLAKNSDGGKYLGKIVVTFCVMLVSAGLITIFLVSISKGVVASDPSLKVTAGKLMIGTQDGNIIHNSVFIKEINSDNNGKKSEKESEFVTFIKSMIPVNIFKSLSNNENLKIIFFCIMFGLMLKFISEKTAESIIDVCEGMFEAFQSLIHFIMYFLPFGICSMVAVQFSASGIDIIYSLIKFVALMCIVSMIILLVSSAIICFFAGCTLSMQLKALNEVMLVALCTRNSIATIPSAIKGLSEGLGLDETKVKLAVPLGITLCRYGTMIAFCIGAVFTIQIYDGTMNCSAVFIISVISILAAMAASGAPGIISKGMISMVLKPLGYSSGPITSIMIVLDPISDPILTLLNTYVNCAAVSIIAGNKISLPFIQKTEYEGAVKS